MNIRSRLIQPPKAAGAFLFTAQQAQLYTIRRIIWLGVFVLISFILSACDSTTILIKTPTVTATAAIPDTPTDTPEPTLTPTPTATASATPTDTPTALPPVTNCLRDASAVDNDANFPLFVPCDDLITTIIEQSTAEPTPGIDHVSPPAERLQALVEAAQAFAETLGEERSILNPITDIANFDQEDAVTYALADRGTILQVVSLAEPVDELLKENKAWEQDVVIIGGLLVYQTSSYQLDVEYDYLARNDVEVELPMGSYLVVLERAGEEAKFTLFDRENGIVTEPGNWQLRLLTKPIKKPVGFITAVDKNRQICFSQIELQACLNLTPPQSPVHLELIQQAFNELNPLLPPDTSIDAQGVFGDITGRQQLEACIQILNETQTDEPNPCVPDLFITGSSPAFEANTEQMNSFFADTFFLAGVYHTAILRVQQPAHSYVMDISGNVTDLPEGSYRLDFLQYGEKPTEWLAQFVRSDKSVFYAPAREVILQGRLVDLNELTINEEFDQADQPSHMNQIILDKYVAHLCSSGGTGAACIVFSGQLRAWCVNSVTEAGWCDIVGYE